MKKILIFWFLAIGMANAQIRIGNVNGDTTTRTTSGLAALAWKNNNLYVVKPSGNTSKFLQNDTRLYVGDNNRVGVGTKNPSQLFEVAGNAKISGSLQIGVGAGILRTDQNGSISSSLITATDLPFLGSTYLSLAGGGTVNGTINVPTGAIVTNHLLANTFRLSTQGLPEGTTFENKILKSDAGGFGTWQDDLGIKNLDFSNNAFTWDVGGASFITPTLLTVSEANSNYAKLADNNNFIGTNKFLTPIFANSTSTSAYSSITGAWSNTGNLGIFSFRYNTRFGSNTITWNPIRLDANGWVGIGIDPTQAFEVLGAAKFNSAITATSILASSNVAAISFSSSTGANFATNSGNVGIGKTNPVYTLDVQGGEADKPVTIFSPNNAPSHSVGLGVDARGEFWGASIFQDNTKMFTIDSNAGVLLGINYQSNNAPANGAIIEGNVGIGTSSPEQKLHIEGLLKIKSYTTTEINSFTGMTIGTITINSTIGLPIFWNGTAWKRFDGSNM